MTIIDKYLPILFKNIDVVYANTSEEDRWNQNGYRLGIHGIENLFNMEIPGPYCRRFKELVDKVK